MRELNRIELPRGSLYKQITEHCKFKQAKIENIAYAKWGISALSKSYVNSWKQRWSRKPIR